MIRIFITDDHAMVAAGVATLLRDEKDFSLIGQANTGKEAIEKVLQERPDVLLLDINLPDSSGLEVCRNVHAEAPEVKVLALSMLNEESYITAMIGAGASGYLLKNSDKDELIAAIRALSAGKTYFSRDVTDIVMHSLGRKQDDKTATAPPKISRRELEVLKLIVDECTTQEIAGKLFLSEKTVESHRAALLTKLGARNTAGLVKMALKWELLKDE
ncbi:MAG: response regulator transcription factor [Saprospiraceae bacterium]|nr:response regulator transcription factor [Saprospiraceae bacterium]